MTQLQSADAQVNEIASLLIPVLGNHLLLPNVSVAEIVPFSRPEPPEGAPEWFLGYLSWRNQKVPLISFEALNGASAQDYSLGNRIAILNGYGTAGTLPFMGFVTQTTPRLVRVVPQELAVDESAELGPLTKMAVSVNGESALIPNIEAIEEAYIKLIEQF